MSNDFDKQKCIETGIIYAERKQQKPVSDIQKKDIIDQVELLSKSGVSDNGISLIMCYFLEDDFEEQKKQIVERTLASKINHIPNCCK